MPALSASDTGTRFGEGRRTVALVAPCEEPAEPPGGGPPPARRGGRRPPGGGEEGRIGGGGVLGGEGGGRVPPARAFLEASGGEGVWPTPWRPGGLSGYLCAERLGCRDSSGGVPGLAPPF